MKSFSISSKHLMILMVFVLPFAFLYYQFLTEKNAKLAQLDFQITKLDLVIKNTKRASELLSLRIKNGAVNKNIIDQKFQSIIEFYAHALVDSNLIFANDYYTYFLTQLTLVRFPELFLQMQKLNQIVEAGQDSKSSKIKVTELLNSISLLANEATINSNHSSDQQLTSVRGYLDQTFVSLGRSDLAFKSSLNDENKSLTKYWLKLLQNLEDNIQAKRDLQSTERMKYSLIIGLLLLLAVTSTMSIFYDMSERIKKLIQVTRYSHLNEISIQPSDYGYDEIGKLAQSFQTMSLSLKDSFDKIEAATNAKSLFLANVSHEIRTPISGIIGMTDFLKETSLDHAQQGYVSVIQKSSSMLLMLINDLLDLSQIESGKMIHERIAFDINEVMQDVYECFYHQALQKNISLKFESNFASISHLKSVWLLGDAHKIKQIIFNLLSNALKFTPQGEVVLWGQARLLPTGSYQLSIGVIDQGIGIAEDKIEKLFHDFVQVDASTRRKYGGTGLGLSLSKKLAVVMGGDLRATSQLGAGSEFVLTLTLPVGQASAEPDIVAALPSRSCTKGLRILVAEDNSVNQIILKKYLKKWNFQSDFVENGALAVAAINGTSSYDFILMDCQMPEMDGFEATRQIKLMQPSLKIIALTANASVEDEIKCRQAGMTGFISKPIDPDALLKILSAS